MQDQGPPNQTPRRLCTVSQILYILFIPVKSSLCSWLKSLFQISDQIADILNAD